MRRNVLNDRRRVADRLLIIQALIEQIFEEKAPKASQQLARSLANYHCVQAFKEYFRNKRSFSEREESLTVSIQVCLGYPPGDDPRALKALARVTGEFAKGLAAGRMAIEELDSLEETLMDFGFDLCTPITRGDPLP